MATDEGILGCWALLQASGLGRPWLTEHEAEQALSAWQFVLADTSDERLVTLTAAWMRSEDVKYGRWPMPGSLLNALPDPDGVDDADEAWSEVLGLLAWRGRDRCPLTVDELEDLRGRLRAAQEQARGDADRLARLARQASRLPREDAHRTEAILAGVRACGGWRALGSCEEGDLVAHRASFRAVYRGYRQRQQLTDGEARVAALFEGHLRLLPGGRS